MLYQFYPELYNVSLLENVFSLVLLGMTLIAVVILLIFFVILLIEYMH